MCDVITSNVPTLAEIGAVATAVAAAVTTDVLVVFAVADAFMIWLPQSGSKASFGTPLDVLD